MEGFFRIKNLSITLVYGSAVFKYMLENSTAPYMYVTQLLKIF